MLTADLFLRDTPASSCHGIMHRGIFHISQIINPRCKERICFANEHFRCVRWDHDAHGGNGMSLSSQMKTWLSLTPDVRVDTLRVNK